MAGEFTVECAPFVEALALVVTAVEKKATLPVLMTVLIDASDGQLHLAATDLELSLRCTCPAKVKKPMRTAVPAKRLFDYVRLVTDHEIQLKQLDSNWVSVVSSRGRSRLAGMGAESFPELPSAPEAIAQVAVSTLNTLVARTAFAVSKEESRFTLNGALLILSPGQAEMVATDGHRLAWARGSAEGVEAAWRAIVPKKALLELAKLSAGRQGEDLVSIAADENHLYFEIGDRLLTARRISGQFPDYERVLPKEAAHTVVAAREELQAALERAAVIADQTSRAVRLELLPDALRVHALSMDTGETEEIVTCAPGGSMEIGFNVEYLLHFLRASPAERVELRVQGPKLAGEFRSVGDDGYRYVVMPMQV